MRALALLAMLAAPVLAQPLQASGRACQGTPCRASTLSVTSKVIVPTSGKVCLDGSACTRYLWFDGTNGRWVGMNGINDNGAWISQNVIVGNGAGQISTNGNATLDLSSSNPDGAAAIGVKLRSAAFANATAKIASFQNSTTEKAYVLQDGYIASATPVTLTSVYANAVASAVTFGGAKLPARAFTATDIGTYVSSAAAGAGTTTVRVSDGTNNCDFAMDCAADTNTTGPKIKATTGGTCTFAASAALTVSITATTCATTQPTLKNIDVRGKWQ